MSGRSPGSQALQTVLTFLGAPRFIAALTLTIVGTATCTFLLRQMIGWPGLIGGVGTLVVLATASIASRRSTIEWRGLLPVSLLVFVAWALISIVWSQYHWATVAGLAYFGAFTVLGVCVALLRDTIQIVRAFGDVLRFALTLSLVVEVLSGLLIDTPIAFLNVLGDIGRLGPIQGIEGTRNHLGTLAVVALITFGIELRTHLVPRGLSAGSITVAAVALLLTQSPLAFGTMVVVGAAAVALYFLRRIGAEKQPFWQVGLLIATLTAAVLTVAFRSAIVTLFNAAGDLTYRLDLWQTAWTLIVVRPLQGWGWVGTWPTDIAPFQVFASLSTREESSASNALVDVWLQLGLVGLAVFVGLVGLAFVRSWLLASRQRSVAYAWPALILVASMTTALGESSILAEFGWLTFVVCCLKAASELSWRGAFRTPLQPEVGPGE